jgi:hypothetical protein
MPSATQGTGRGPRLGGFAPRSDFAVTLIRALTGASLRHRAKLPLLDEARDQVPGAARLRRTASLARRMAGARQTARATASHGETPAPPTFATNHPTIAASHTSRHATLARRAIADHQTEDERDRKEQERHVFLSVRLLEGQSGVSESLRLIVRCTRETCPGGGAPRSGSFTPSWSG